MFYGILICFRAALGQGRVVGSDHPPACLPIVGRGGRFHRFRDGVEGVVGADGGARREDGRICRPCGRSVQKGPKVAQGCEDGPHHQKGGPHRPSGQGRDGDPGGRTFAGPHQKVRGHREGGARMEAQQRPRQCGSAGSRPHPQRGSGGGPRGRHCRPGPRQQQQQQQQQQKEGRRQKECHLEQQQQHRVVQRRHDLDEVLQPQVVVGPLNWLCGGQQRQQQHRRHGRSGRVRL